MAMVCRNGVRECTGCCMCYDEDEDEKCEEWADCFEDEMDDDDEGEDEE